MTDLQYRFWIPEIVQTSGMDCGPAALASLLNGCGFGVSYPRLRESCQTDVDGTSIDRLEELACKFGLDAEQVIVPNDSIVDGVDRSLPCIAVITLPNGLTHFVVAWNAYLGYVQVMDPAVGRRWIKKRAFLDSLYQHQMVVSKSAWMSYVESEEFRSNLRVRVQEIRPESEWIDTIMDATYAGNDWRRIASFDALVRLAGVLPRDRAGELLDAYAEAPAAVPELLSSHLSQVSPAENNPDGLIVRGAVLIRVRGVSSGEYETSADPIVSRARSGPTQGALKDLRSILSRTDLRKAFPFVIIASLITGFMTIVEGLLFRYLLDLNLSEETVIAVLVSLMILTPLLASAVVEYGLLGLCQSIGRQIDSNLRRGMLERLPKIRDEYFSSRLISDLAMRGHNVSELKGVPDLLRHLTTAFVRLIWLAAGLLWLVPGSNVAVLMMLAFALIIPMMMFPLLRERDLRARAHLAALGRLHLDSLRGAEAIWSHNSAGAVAYEHEQLQVAWWRCVFDKNVAATVVEFVASLFLYALAMSVIWQNFEAAGSTPGTVLLLAYWSFSLPTLSITAFGLLQELAPLRNIQRRALEVFAEDELQMPEKGHQFDRPVSVEFRNVEVSRGQIPVLRTVNLTIPAGQRVAVVGASGAGKSSLIATILGFATINSGSIYVQGQLATQALLAALRQHSAVVDSETYLWNKSIIDNLLYGGARSSRLGMALTRSRFRHDLSRISGGLRARVGENGSRLSGGESQRLRLARGVMRLDPVLVLLDEPLRGMDSEQRKRLLDELLELWKESTLIYVSHNIAETQSFDRILVLDDRRVVEDGSPAELVESSKSRYSGLLAAELELSRSLERRWLARRIPIKTN